MSNLSSCTVNNKSAYTTIGASNHANKERETNDYYATDPKAAELICKLESFSVNIWECACGEGHLSKVFEQNGYNVYSSDLVNRGYGDAGVDFLSRYEVWNGDIITNPPYKLAKEFVEHALSIVPIGKKVAMFLKLTFMESQSRRKLFDTQPPKTIWVSSSRLQCAMNGDFDTYKKGTGTAIAYAWYIWEKGYTGETSVRWFN